MEINKANPVRPAYLKQGKSDCVRQSHEKRNAQGPTPHLAWKLATAAKHIIAMKLKNIWDECATMVGFDTIIYKGQK